ncbi:MAG: TrkA C-terminal domain-containing protein [Candidatus Omnitrophota bacterium]
MIALIGLLIIIIMSIIVVRVGAIALELTGLSPEVSSFQAQSAFSGAGFTTSESESIVTHPVRRKIIRVLILLGSAGVTTSMATLVLTFMGKTGTAVVKRGLALLLGILIIFLLARSKYIYNIMKKIISKSLKKWTKMRIFDYEQLLGFDEGYTISRIKVRKDCWLSDKKLSELRLDKEGVLVLSIYRKIGHKEKFIGAPTGDTIINAGDVLICYSRQEVAESFSGIRKGTES